MSRSSTESRIRDIPLEDIDRSHNHRIPRFGDAERVQALKQSMEACGQLQAIRVYERGEDQKDPKHKQPYILCFGDRRCQAMELLDRKTVRAVVFPPTSTAEIAQARAVENLHRQDITPLEEVLAVADVIEAVKADASFTGDPFEEATARLGCEVAWIKDRDYLHRLTKPVQRFALRSGLPAGHLRELSKLGDPKEQMRLACESVGAPSHAFPFEPKDVKVIAWQHQLQDQYFAQLSDGKIERWPLTHLKNQVAKVQLSLRLIPWEFDQPVEFGSTKLRKCAGCPHNSESDRTLFGIDEDVANPHGYCLHASCYNAKHAATDAAKAQVLKKISPKEDQSPTAIRKITPGWLKEDPVVGFVKRQLDKATNGEKASAATRTRPTPTDGRTLTDHEQRLIKFAEVFRMWEETAFAAVFQGINADPLHRVSWCVLLGVPIMWAHPRVEIPGVRAYSQAPTVEDPVFPPLPEALEQAIRMAFKGTRNAWAELLKDHEQTDPDQRSGLGVPHPRALEIIAELLKVKLPAVPEWTPTKAEAVHAPELGEPVSAN